MNTAIMISAARAQSPREACGVVAGGITYVIENVAKHPEAFFALNHDQLIAVYSRHGDIDAVWHSHPGGNPKPSTTDWANHPPGKAMVIVAAGVAHAYIEPT